MGGMNSMGYDFLLKLGIIQTTVNNSTAWQSNGKLQLCMNSYARKKVLDEIRSGFKDFFDRSVPPQIVLIPEYSIPNCGMNLLKNYSKNLNAVIIGGMDLQINDDGTVSNKGVIIIPNKWGKKLKSSFSEVIYFGKNYYAEEEIDWFQNNKPPVKFKSDSVNYIIDASVYGNIGIAICSDFYDLNRFAIYRGRIHHLLIISYNKDYKSFEFLAEAISRLLLCNVVICNSGKYGNSLAYSPYREEYKRIVYKSSGANLFSTQVISLPVDELNKNQIEAHEKFQNSSTTSSKNSTFKWPPGYKKI